MNFKPKYTRFGYLIRIPISNLQNCRQNFLLLVKNYVSTIETLNLYDYCIGFYKFNERLNIIAFLNLILK